MRSGRSRLIERRNWQAQVRQANDAFKTELLDAAGNAYERLAVQRCLQDRLRAIADRLSEPGSQWRGMPETFKGAETYYSNVLPVVYRPPGRASLTDAWRNALADDTIDHLDGQQARNLSEAYAIIEGFNDFGLEGGGGRVQAYAAEYRSHARRRRQDRHAPDGFST